MSAILAIAKEIASSTGLSFKNPEFMSVPGPVYAASMSAPWPELTHVLETVSLSDGFTTGRMGRSYLRAKSKSR